MTPHASISSSATHCVDRVRYMTFIAVANGCMKLEAFCQSECGKAAVHVVIFKKLQFFQTVWTEHVDHRIAPLWVSPGARTLNHHLVLPGDITSLTTVMPLGEPIRTCEHSLLW